MFFYVEKLFPDFWYTLPIHAISQTKSVCVKLSISQGVCSYSYLYYLHVDKLSMSMYLTTTVEAGDAATHNAAVWLFLAQ